MKKYMYVVWAVIGITVLPKTAFFASSSDDSSSSGIVSILPRHMPGGSNNILPHLACQRDERVSEKRMLDSLKPRLIRGLIKEPSGYMTENGFVPRSRVLRSGRRASSQPSSVTLPPLSHTSLEPVIVKRGTFPLDKKETQRHTSTRRNQKGRERLSERRKNKRKNRSRREGVLTLRRERRDVQQLLSGASDLAQLQPADEIVRLHRCIKHGFSSALRDYDSDFFAEHEGINAIERSLLTRNQKMVMSVLQVPQVQERLNAGDTALVPYQRLNNTLNVNGKHTTYLHLAAGTGQFQLVDHLLALDADLQSDFCNNTPLEVALKLYDPYSETHLDYAKIIKSLCQHFQGEDEKLAYFPGGAYFLACLLQDFIVLEYPEGVSRLISRSDVNVNGGENGFFDPPLCTAVMHYCLADNEQTRNAFKEIIVMLLQARAKLNVMFKPSEGSECIELTEYIRAHVPDLLALLLTA